MSDVIGGSGGEPGPLVTSGDDAPPRLLPDFLRPGLRVVFVGAAPSFAAASTGHYYAGGRNRFWLLLHQAGFTPRLLAAEEDAEVLDHGIGLTAILPGHISTDNSRLPPPTERERAYLLRKLREAAPRFVCYNGRDVYRMVFGEDPAGWGLQPERLGDSIQFVAHSSSGRADKWGADRLTLWSELKRLVDESAGEHART
jgi:TDG/mug DNA glycosylase family protein